MQLYVLSDLHLEFAWFEPDAAAVEQADVVVLAGDIDMGTAGIQWAAREFAGKPVVYVSGNHEFHGQHWDEHLLDMRTCAQRLGVHFLEDSAVVIGGVRFLGATLWTDFLLRGPRRQQLLMRDFERVMPDCKAISASTPSSPEAHLTAQLVLQRHERSRQWLARELASFAGPTVVVTHHAPSGRSVAPEFVGDPMNASFVSELPQEMLDAAAVWIHGHTHASLRYRTFAADSEGCDVVCNPRGYPRNKQRSGFENPHFDAALLVHVDARLEAAQENA